ncbi:SH3 domain-containing protein [Acidovorax sp.]|uniref:SH3 domain-containing protein n=1 Tax=Acidovorax sp. TaxID=1872122 RepID=UPI0025C0B2D1|nr:SH3 domain-containing protein [Acidovorax sp.]
MKTLLHATQPRRVATVALLAAALAGSAIAQVPAVAPAKSRYVQGSWVNLRESTQPQARVVAQVPANTVLQQLTERDGWCAVLYAGDARLGPLLAEPLQAHIACNLLADQPLSLAQAGKDAARAFWVAPSPNRLRAYGNALPRPPALQLPTLAKSHAHEMPVQYPTRPEWEAAKKLMRAGVLLQPEQEIDRGRPVNPLDDLKLATRPEYDNIPAVAPLAAKPALPAIAPSYFRSHTSVALLHETDADGLAAVAGIRISVIPTGAPVGRFNRHSGPEIEYITGFWDVGSADQAFAPALTVYAITHKGLVGAHTVRQRYWDISNEEHYCGGHYPGRGFNDPGEEAQPVRGYAKLSDSAEVLTRLVLPGKLPPDAVKVKTRRYATSWMQPADPPIRDKPQRKNTAVLVHEIDVDRDGIADILRIDTPSPGSMSFEPIFEWRWYLNIGGQWFRAGVWVDQECT